MEVFSSLVPSARNTLKEGQGEKRTGQEKLTGLSYFITDKFKDLDRLIFLSSSPAIIYAGCFNLFSYYEYYPGKYDCFTHAG